MCVCVCVCVSGCVCACVCARAHLREILYGSHVIGGRCYVSLSDRHLPSSGIGIGQLCASIIRVGILRLCSTAFRGGGIPSSRKKYLSTHHSTQGSKVNLRLWMHTLEWGSTQRLRIGRQCALAHLLLFTAVCLSTGNDLWMFCCQYIPHSSPRVMLRKTSLRTVLRSPAEVKTSKYTAWSPQGGSFQTHLDLFVQFESPLTLGTQQSIHCLSGVWREEY